MACLLLVRKNYSGIVLNCFEISALCSCEAGDAMSNLLVTD